MYTIPLRRSKVKGFPAFLRSISRDPPCAKPMCHLKKLALFSNQASPAKDRPQNGREKRGKLYDTQQVYAPIHSLPNLRAVDLPIGGQVVQRVSFRILVVFPESRCASAVPIFSSQSNRSAINVP